MFRVMLSDLGAVYGEPLYVGDSEMMAWNCCLKAQDNDVETTVQWQDDDGSWLKW